jgi:hypothetical protein
VGRLAIILVLCTLPHAAHADVRFAIGNDVFTDAIPPMDDSGFTNDLDLHVWRPRGAYLVGGRVVHRWITEKTSQPAGLRRDQLDVLATAERTWGEPTLRDLTIAARVGPTFTGNLAGRWMQNGWHTLCHCGTTLDEGLQSRYEGDGAAGALAGTRVRGAIGVGIAQAYAFTDAQLAIGTGVSSLEGAVGGRLVGRIGSWQLGTHLELAVMRFHVTDERLALPGAYRAGWQGAWRVGVRVARGRVAVDYELRANEGGSGEPFALIAFTVKQAGSSF